MIRSYRPLRDKIIVKVDIGEQVSKGGIVMATDKSSESLSREEGVIIALGKSCFYDTESEELKPGDKVAFARYAGKTLGKDVDGLELRTLRDIDVLCVIQETE